MTGTEPLESEVEAMTCRSVVEPELNVGANDTDSFDTKKMKPVSHFH